MTIPKVLHRVVLPPMTSTGLVEDYWQGFRAMHPGWELKTWTSTRPEDWPETGHLLARCNSPSMMSDLMRFEVLWREGGVYVDTDVEPLRPLDDLLDMRAFVCRSFNGEYLESAVIGAEPDHPALRGCLDDVIATLDPKASPMSSGPPVVTRVWSGRDDVTILPTEVGFPELPNSDPLDVRATADDLRERFPEARVVHRWAHTWAPKPPLSERLKAAYRHSRWLVRHTVRQRLLPPPPREVVCPQDGLPLVAAEGEGGLIWVHNDGLHPQPLPPRD